MTVMRTGVLMWLARRVAARAICLSLRIGQDPVLFLISPITSTTGRRLGFERDYSSHTAFRVCYVIMYIVYCFFWGGGGF